MSLRYDEGHETGTQPSSWEVTRAQKMLKGHLLRVVYHRVYSSIRIFFVFVWRTDVETALTQSLEGGLVFKAHRRLYHSTLGLRVIKEKKNGLKG